MHSVGPKWRACMWGWMWGLRAPRQLSTIQRTKSVVSRGAHKYDIIKTNVPGRAEQHPSLWIEVDIHHYILEAIFRMRYFSHTALM